MVVVMILTIMFASPSSSTNRSLPTAPLSLEPEKKVTNLSKLNFRSHSLEIWERWKRRKTHLHELIKMWTWRSPSGSSTFSPLPLLPELFFSPPSCPISLLWKKIDVIHVVFYEILMFSCPCVQLCSFPLANELNCRSSLLGKVFDQSCRQWDHHQMVKLWFNSHSRHCWPLEKRWWSWSWACWSLRVGHCHCWPLGKLLKS